MTQEQQKPLEPEQVCSTQYEQLAKHNGESFVDKLSLRGYSLEQIGDITRDIQSTFGMDAELFGKPVGTNSLPSHEQTALTHAAKWIAEVNTHAQFHVTGLAGGLNNERTVPSLALTRFSPSYRRRFRSSSKGK